MKHMKFVIRDKAIADQNNTIFKQLLLCNGDTRNLYLIKNREWNQSEIQNQWTNHINIFPLLINTIYMC